MLFCSQFSASSEFLFYWIKEASLYCVMSRRIISAADINFFTD